MHISKTIMENIDLIKYEFSSRSKNDRLIGFKEKLFKALKDFSSSLVMIRKKMKMKIETL